MKKIENKEVVLNRLDIIYKIIGIVCGGLLLFLSLHGNVNRQFIIMSSIYLLTVLIFILFGKWDKVFNSKFLTALNRSGITGVYLNSEANYRKVLFALTGNKNGEIKNIKIIVYNGHNLLTYIKEPLKEAIKNNAKVRIIIAENDSKFIKDTLKLESIHEKISFEKIENENHNKEEVSFEIIKELFETAVKEGGNFKYKRYTTQARYALVAINKDWGWWTPYHTGLKVQNTTSFVIEKEKEPDNSTILGQCIDHFNTLWNFLPDPDSKEIQDISDLKGINQ
jgi:hypothetical protein